MIIWGSTGKEKKIGAGQFYCPQCRANAGYIHKRVARYFTLYFIPLFSMETLGEYVQCGQCQGQFDATVVQLSAEQIESMLQPWECAGCGNRNPNSEADCLNCGAARAEPVESA